MTETEQLREEVSELREAVMHLAAQAVMVRHAFVCLPDGRKVGNEPQKSHSHLTSLCYWLRGTAENTENFYGTPWVRALEKRSAKTIETIRAQYATGDQLERVKEDV